MIIKGKMHWAKVLGKPVGGYPEGKGPEEWSVDLEVDDQAIAQLLEAGADESYIKEHKTGGYKFVKFVRKAITFAGDPGKPFKIVGPDNKDWDQDRLIGNGTDAFAKVEIQEVPGSKKMKPRAFSFKIIKHVPYEGAEEFPEVEGAEDWS